MYLQYILNSPNCYEQSQSRTRGVANRNLVLNDIKQINFPLPQLQTQRKVVAYLDEISQKLEKIKQLQKEKMQSLKALKASILDKAFRGEL
jgi:type I restriction enzyme S subunit